MRAHPCLRPASLLCAPLLLCATLATAAPAGWQVVEEIRGTPSAGEPRVQRIVVEDDNASIEELHVRGEAQRITVQPKGPGPKARYEIIPASGARNMTPVLPSQRDLAGQRVWTVLQF